ncbi:MAG: NAD(P)/FAD-dependent oxidoreductase [Bacteroidia bacterium]
MTESWDIIVVGGGAAGFFAAIRVAELQPDWKVLILERGKEVLSKVRISGGGRCNLTHACFEPKELVKFYPRGQKELRGPFHRFCSGDTVDWFEKRGVETKIEADGRMFPASDSSQSIINALYSSVRQAGIEVRTQTNVQGITPPENASAPWILRSKETEFSTPRLLLATGSNPRMWQMLGDIGLKMVDPVPSLFTFNIKDARLQDLPGLSVPNASLRIPTTKLSSNGPLLITHWGLSGPGILKLSAWGARELNDKDYKFELWVNWLGTINREDAANQIQNCVHEWAKKTVLKANPFGLASRLWQRLASYAGVTEGMKWSDLPKGVRKSLLTELCEGRYQVDGKSTFKEEFVTAGGVSLKEINFKSFSAKRFERLWLAGEMLNIDAVTGGFNFQAAWTGGWIAGESMSETILETV